MSELDKTLCEVCARAVAVYGATAQLRQLQEECGELIVAVSHFERERADELGVADELADVIIMCTQAAEIVGKHHVRDALWRKLRRLATQVEATEKRLEQA